MFFYTYNQLFHHQIHLGGTITSSNKKVSSFFFGKRNNLILLDMLQTYLYYKKIFIIISNNVYFNKISLFIINRLDNQMIFNIAFQHKFKRHILCYNYRWLPGILTNFKNKHKKDAGEIINHVFYENFKKLKRDYYNRMALSSFPQFVFCLKGDSNVQLECFPLKLLNANITDSSYNIHQLSNTVYKIPGNPDSIISLHFYKGVLENFLKIGLLRKYLFFKELINKPIFKKF